VSRQDLNVLQKQYNLLNPQDRKRYIRELEREMVNASRDLDFERAIIFRDEIERIKREYAA